MCKVVHIFTIIVSCVVVGGADSSVMSSEEESEVVSH